jgi:hypothetical protein
MVAPLPPPPVFAKTFKTLDLLVKYTKQMSYGQSIHSIEFVERVEIAGEDKESPAREVAGLFFLLPLL